VFGERRRSRLPSISWRPIAIALGIVAVCAAAYWAVVWSANSSYFVGIDGDEVVVFRGQPDGVLWLEPEIVERTGIEQSELGAAEFSIINRGKSVDSRDKALEFIDTLDLLTPFVPAEPASQEEDSDITSVPSGAAGQSPTTLDGIVPPSSGPSDSPGSNSGSSVPTPSTQGP